MASDQSLLDLYSDKILALTASLSTDTDIPSDFITAKARSPLCGSYLTVGIKMTGDVISDYRQNVKACALGQASAAIFDQRIRGLNQQQVETGRAQIKAMLQGDQAPLEAPFAAYEVLRAAQEFSNRHASIMLPFTATLDALSRVEDGA